MQARLFPTSVSPSDLHSSPCGRNASVRAGADTGAGKVICEDRAVFARELFPGKINKGSTPGENINQGQTESEH